MPQFNPPIKNSAYSFPAFLRSQADSTLFVSNATVGTVDVSISTEFGSWASLTNVPAPTPAAGKQLMVSLTAAEMNADNVTILFSDVVGAQWFDRAYNFQTVVGASWSTFNSSNDSVGLKAVSHSGATVQGVTRVNSNVTPADGVYSAVSVRVQAGNYASHTTFGAGTFALGDYSGVSFGANNITPRVYSGVSVEVKTGGIQAASFGANAVDAAAVASDAWSEGADRLLLRNIAGGADSGRSVGEALFAIRNRASLSSQSYFVYQNDDVTVAWEASLSTVDDTVRITDLNPTGP